MGRACVHRSLHGDAKAPRRPSPAGPRWPAATPATRPGTFLASLHAPGRRLLRLRWLRLLLLLLPLALFVLGVGRSALHERRREDAALAIDRQQLGAAVVREQDRLAGDR